MSAQPTKAAVLGPVQSHSIFSAAHPLSTTNLRTEEKGTRPMCEGSTPLGAHLYALQSALQQV